MLGPKRTQGDKKVKLAPFDTDFVHYMANSLPFMATSGLYGIIIALHHCAEVDLYGFQVSNQHGMKCRCRWRHTPGPHMPRRML